MKRVEVLYIISENQGIRGSSRDIYPFPGNLEATPQLDVFSSRHRLL